MKEFKGTAGPWIIDGQDNGARWNIDDENGHAVAMSFQRPDDKCYLERDANASLIAAAPELLEALQSIDEQLRNAWDSGKLPWNAVDIKTIHLIKAVINKALGEGTNK